jgi:hypothetical protein
MALLKSEVSSIKFLGGMLICLLENGSFVTFLTEVRRPLKRTLFPNGMSEIIPMYEANRNFGGLITQEGIVRYTAADHLVLVN